MRISTAKIWRNGDIYSMQSNLKQFWVYIESDPSLYLATAAILLLCAAISGHFFIKFVIRRIAKAVAQRVSAVAAELIQDDTLYGRLSLFIPTLMIYLGVDLLPDLSPFAVKIIQKLGVIVALVIGLGVLTRLMFKGNEIYCRFAIARTRPIKGYLQVVTIILYAVGLIIVIATVLDKSPLVFVSGLGAMTAIILLVFRDTLLSLVAGVQLTTNDLIRVGDWIEMPQFEADGDVVDIALHVVKVQNWDMTITVIPTHKFLEHSFRNWRGMSESGGRRIKRSIFMDVNTVRFLNEEEIVRFGQFELLKEYIAKKRQELADYNRERDNSDVLVSNGRRLTNIGTFRAYLINYLRQHPQIHQEMTFLVRQLQPTSEGVPLEIYVFSKDTRWAVYEGIQADIFDHVIAVVQKFDLRIYQRPSGQDLRRLESQRDKVAGAAALPTS